MSLCVCARVRARVCVCVVVVARKFPVHVREVARTRQRNPPPPRLMPCRSCLCSRAVMTEEYVDKGWFLRFKDQSACDAAAVRTRCAPRRALARIWRVRWGCSQKHRAQPGRKRLGNFVGRRVPRPYAAPGRHPRHPAASVNAPHNSPDALVVVVTGGGARRPVR